LAKLQQAKPGTFLGHSVVPLLLQDEVVLLNSMLNKKLHT